MSTRKLPNRFRLSPRGTFLALVSAAFAQPAFANTGGHVDFAIGNVTVTSGEGRVQPLRKGAEVGSGDKIVSGVDGRVQIRFSDGAYVSLQPNSEFDIKDYRYDGKTDGTESAVFGLFKGALRTITGLVGRVNRSKYQITTPTATIGIRGTGGLIQVGSDGSTLVTGTSGIWSLSNNGGTLQIPAGSSGFAGNNQNLPPRQSTDGPVVPPAQPTVTQPQEPQTVVQGNNVTPQGTPIGPVLLTGSGYAMGANDGSVFNPVVAPANVVFDAQGRPVQFPLSTDGIGTITLTNGSYAPSPETGTNGILAWGRWIGTIEGIINGSQQTRTYSANQGLHFVVGTPTTTAEMPTGASFTYTLIGATRPTFADGSSDPGTFKGTLVGDFVSGRVGLSMTAAMLNKTYAFQTAGFTLGGSNATSEISISGATFGGIVSSTGCGGSGCSASVNGFFAGSGATHAGMIYKISDSATGATVTGAAAFQR